MILPQTYTFALLVMIVGLLCQGSWANLFKTGGRSSRFELMYFDFAIGALVVALLLGFTFGNLGWDGFSIVDDFARAGKRQWLYAFIAGASVNLATMLLTGAISVGGLAMPFLIASSVALLGIAAMSFGTADPTLLGIACLLLVAAVVAGVVFYKRKPVLLSIVSGLAFVGFYPMAEKGRYGDIGLGPYSEAVMVCFGVIFTTIVYNLFFMNLPVAGEPLEFLDYVKVGLKVHRFGAIGGAIWGAGLVATFAVAGAPSEAQIGKALTLGLTQAAAIVAALWGLAVWRESSRAWVLLGLFTAGLAVLCYS